MKNNKFSQKLLSGEGRFQKAGFFKAELVLL
jgi:hypothetical protein